MTNRWDEVQDRRDDVDDRRTRDLDNKEEESKARKRRTTYNKTSSPAQEDTEISVSKRALFGYRKLGIQKGRNPQNSPAPPPALLAVLAGPKEWTRIGTRKTS